MVQDVPPGVPGPFSVYLVDSLPNPDRSFFTLPRVCAPSNSKSQHLELCCIMQFDCVVLYNLKKFRHKLSNMLLTTNLAFYEVMCSCVWL